MSGKKEQYSIPQMNIPEPDSDGSEKKSAETKNAAAKTRRAAAGSKDSGHLPVKLGKAVRLPVPDFSDPDRPLTCLEVDFPIAQINALSNLEGNAGKPIYQMSKWWARRRSSVFRSMLIAAATEAPKDPTEAAKKVWDHYYCNHQKAGSFKKLKVLDPFMGGGTTLVEGSRLGMQMTGVDLNPVAWFVVKNELACSDPEQVKALFEHIEAGLRKGNATGGKARRLFIPSGQSMGPARPRGAGIGRRFSDRPLWPRKNSAFVIECICPDCGLPFDAELGETRMAPGVERVVLESEKPFSEMNQPFAQLLKNYDKGRVDDTMGRMWKLKRWRRMRLG